MTKFALMALLAPIAFGQQYNRPWCSNDAVAGTYVASCTGFITPVANGPSLPMTVLGTVTGDLSGYFSGIGTNMIAGAMTTAAMAGPAQVNSDCTGKITYNKGTPGEMNVQFVVLSNGDEMRGIVVDKGANVSCQLIRIRPYSPR